MKIQNIIGAILIVTGAILLWYSTKYGFGNFPAYLGQAIGRTMIILLIVLLVLAATPYRKKAALTLVIGIVWAGSVSTISYELYNKGSKERKSGVAVVELLDSFTTGEEISTDSKSTNNESVENWMRDYLSKVQSIHLEYSNEIVASGFAEMLSPENLTNIKKAKQSKEKIKQLSNSVSVYEKRLFNEFNKAEMIISKRSDGASRAAYEGFLKTKQDGIQTTKRYFVIQQGIINAFGNILDLSINSNGKIYLQEGQLLFENQETLDSYNEQLARIDELSTQEEKMMLEQQQRMQAAKTQINDTL